jgi:pyruvate,orthophosphate dikinase
MEAACEVAKSTKQKPLVEIMVPIVGHKRELEIVRERSEKIATETMKRYGVKLDYKIGTMIEIPRAAITADQVAQAAEFFSFGTNDLTQTTLGVSRDDSGSFLPFYSQLQIYPTDPFDAIDQEGVGQMMEIAVRKGRATRPKLKIGICGEHGGEPSSVEFCHRIGLDYVSCSPYRVPIARMAAAHAVLKEKGDAKEKD